MLTFLYFLSIVASYLIFREMAKLHREMFDDTELKDIVVTSTLLVIPVFNIIITVCLYKVLSRKTGEDYSDIIKKLFMIK